MKNESKGWYSMEIMVGRRVNSSEPMTQEFVFLQMAEAINSFPNPRKFYDGFAHRYFPKE